MQFLRLPTYKGSKCNATLKKYANAKGVVKFKLPKLDIGKYTVKIHANCQDFESNTVKTSLTIKKDLLEVSDNDAFNELNKNGKFKVKVKDSNNKVVKNLKIKLKVYTGKKYKVYNLKTNSKGIASINTKKLSFGNHKVVVSTSNKNYKINKKATIKIGKKKGPIYVKMGKQKTFKNKDGIDVFVDKYGSYGHKNGPTSLPYRIGGTEPYETKYTYFYKIEYIFKNDKTGKTIIKHDKSNQNSVKPIKGYTPIYAKIWYLDSSK